MGKKTSIYLPDYVAEALAASTESPSVLIRRGLAVRPLLTEWPEGERTWATRWYCQPPDNGARYKVLCEEWAEEPWPVSGELIPSRMIFEVEVTSPG